MLLLRTLLFYLWLALVIVFGCVLVLLAAVFLPLKARFFLVRYCNLLVIYGMRYLCGIRYQVEGLEHVNPASPMVVACNHQSDWETFYLLTIGIPISTVLKKELLRIPFFGWALACIAPIAIDRANKSGALKQLSAQGCRNLSNGLSVLIFPEGTRVAPGQLATCTKGAALLAKKANVPILPVVQNSGYVCSPKRFIKKPGLVRVRFGEPIMSDSTQSLHAEMESWLSSNLKQIDSEGQ